MSAKRFLIAIAVIAAVAPAAAWAGKKAVSGQQSLQLKVSIKPARAGARGVKFHFHSHYLSTQPGGGQPPYNTHQVILTAPKGFALKTSAAASCLESKLTAANGNASTACPKSSQVGEGTIVVNARPTYPSLITGTVTVYNAKDDNGADGYPKGSRALALYIKTSIGANLTDVFHVVKKGAHLRFVNTQTKPSKPGVAPGTFSIQTIDLTIHDSTNGKPFIVAPPTCAGSWPFALTTTNYFGQPSVTAHDRVKCHK